jgi:hypothetical protein
MTTEETYDTIMSRAARRLGISTPDEAVDYALHLLAQLVEELESGGQLLVQHDWDVHELVLRDAARAGAQPLRKLELSASERPTRRLASG